MDIRQISVFLENKPGSLFALTTLLSGNSINLLALNLAETEDYGIARIIVDKTDEAEALIKREGYLCKTDPVVCVSVPNVAGGLNKILEAISVSDADIGYMYSIIAADSGKAYIVLKAKTPGEIRAALKKRGITPAGTKDLGIDLDS